jgi:hypothetical protein
MPLVWYHHLRLLPHHHTSRDKEVKMTMVTTGVDCWPDHVSFPEGEVEILTTSTIKMLLITSGFHWTILCNSQPVLGQCLCFMRIMMWVVTLQNPSQIIEKENVSNSLKCLDLIDYLGFKCWESRRYRIVAMTRHGLKSKPFWTTKV